MLYPVKVTFKNPVFKTNTKNVTLENDLSIITDMLDNETDQSTEFIKHIHDCLTAKIYNNYFKKWSSKISYEKLQESKELMVKVYNDTGFAVPQQSTYIIEPIYQPLVNIKFKPRVIWSNEKIEKNKYRE